MFCKYCGSQIPDDSKVCSSCGKTLAAAPPPVAPPPAGMPGTNPVGNLTSGVTAAISGSGLPLAKVIRITLIAAILVFFLPFMTVSCEGYSSKDLSETYSGFELVTTIGSGSDELLQQSKQSAKMNIFVAGALVCAIAAAALYFTAKNHKVGAMMSLIGAGLLVLARLTFRIYYGLNGEYSDYIKVEMRFGMILAILLFIVNAALLKSSEAPQSTSSPSAPYSPPPAPPLS